MSPLGGKRAFNETLALGGTLTGSRSDLLHYGSHVGHSVLFKNLPVFQPVKSHARRAERTTTRREAEKWALMCSTHREPHRHLVSFCHHFLQRPPDIRESRTKHPEQLKV